MITGATQGQVGELMAYAAKLFSQLTTSDIQTLESGNLPDILQGTIS